MAAPAAGVCRSLNPPSANSCSKLRWTQSWVLAGAVGVAIVEAMEVSVPVTFYLFHLVQGVCCAVLWAVSVRKDSGLGRSGIIVGWMLGWSLSRDLWPANPPDAKYTLSLLRVAVAVIPMAAAAVGFTRYFVPKADEGASESGGPKAKGPQ